MRCAYLFLLKHFSKSVEKASDARNGDEGVLEVRLGAMTKQMMLYTASTQQYNLAYQDTLESIRCAKR